MHIIIIIIVFVISVVILRTCWNVENAYHTVIKPWQISYAVRRETDKQGMKSYKISFYEFTRSW